MQVSIVISLDCDLETHYIKKDYGLVRNIFVVLSPHFY